MDLYGGSWDVREITAVSVFARAVADATEVVYVAPPRPAAGIVDARTVRHSVDAHLDRRHVLVRGTLNWRIQYVPARGRGDVDAFTAREGYRVRVPLTFDAFMTPVRNAEPEVSLIAPDATLRRVFLCADEEGRIGLVIRVRGRIEVSGPVRMCVAVLSREDGQEMGPKGSREAP